LRVGRRVLVTPESLAKFLHEENRKVEADRGGRA
jgi:hypothetical protein